MTRCRDCDAPLTFAKITGQHGRVRLMPFDAEPKNDGEWLVARETAAYIGKAPSLTPDGRHHIHKCPKEETT